LFAPVHWGCNSPSISAWYPGLQTNQTSLDVADNTTGHVEFYTGESDHSLMRSLTKWDGDDTLMGCPSAGCPPHAKVPAWATPLASHVPLASEGVQFHPEVQPVRKKTNILYLL
jgi:hypothetical protein